MSSSSAKSALTDGVFLDTSALYAVFDGDDCAYAEASRTWGELLRLDTTLHISNYVIVELTALLQRRLGVAAVDALTAYLLPWVNISWIGEALHDQAVAGLLTGGRRDLSLVDCASFAAMRKLGLRRVFTFDAHFAEQGFEVLPAAS